MSRKRLISRALGLFLAGAFLFSNVYSVSVKAAEPVITFQNKTEEAASSEDTLRNVNQRIGKTKVSNLRLINLEQPKAGEKLDTRATVLADKGLFWEIPVVWIDEDGKASLICLPGKTYKPVFAFFVPTNVEVVNDGENGYSLRLPEFLDGIYTSDNIIMVGSAAYGITYIVTTDIAENLGNQSALMDSTGALSNILSDNDIQNFFSTTSRDNIRNFVDYTAERERQQAEEARNNSASTSQPGTQNVAPSSGTESGSGSSESDDEPIDPPVVKDLVKLHCSNACIEGYGTEKLNKVLNLIINVIEPQAVKALYTGFNTYSTGAKSGAIGKEIGLYVYSTAHTDGSQKDLKGAVAYVDGNYYAPNNTCDDYRYFIGVNVESLFEKDKDTQEYIFKENALTELDNTMVHELMHAYMDDYTRVGMMGVTIDEKNNKFPTWFIEGTATCVDNAYTYHYDLFDNMADKNRAEGASKYTEDSLLTYYSTDQGDKAGHPSIDYSLGKYNENNNRAADYVSGYLATIYLASLANDRYSSDKVKVENAETNTFYMDSAAVRNGLNTIIDYLYKGVSLDEIVKTISGKEYENVEDFQKKFLTKTNETKDPSIDFCLDLLNYLDYATTEVIKDPEGNKRANGSILLPFDTKETSSIDDKATAVESIGLLVITDSNDAVKSTVDNAEALKSAGLRTTGTSENSVIDEQKQAAKDDISTENSEALIDDVDKVEEETEAVTDDAEKTADEAEVTTEDVDKTADDAGENGVTVDNAEKTVEEAAETEENGVTVDDVEKTAEDTEGDEVTEVAEDITDDADKASEEVPEVTEDITDDVVKTAEDKEVTTTDTAKTAEVTEEVADTATDETAENGTTASETAAESKDEAVKAADENIEKIEAAPEICETQVSNQEIADPLPQADVPDALASDEQDNFETEVADTGKDDDPAEDTSADESIVEESSNEA